jgi:hypothetical protein
MCIVRVFSLFLLLLPVIELLFLVPGHVAEFCRAALALPALSTRTATTRKTTLAFSSFSFLPLTSHSLDLLESRSEWPPSLLRLPTTPTRPSIRPPRPLAAVFAAESTRLISTTMISGRGWTASCKLEVEVELGNVTKTGSESWRSRLTRMRSLVSRLISFERGRGNDGTVRGGARLYSYSSY